MKVVADDDLHGYLPTWLGPDKRVAGFWPEASYVALLVCLSLFIVIVTVEAATPIPGWTGWEPVLAILGARLLMLGVDSDRPLRSLWRPLWSDLNAPRTTKPKTLRRRVCTDRVRVTGGNR